MRAFARLFWILAAFFAFAAVLYSVWTWLYAAQDLATSPLPGEQDVGIEWVGTTGLALCGALSVLIAFYLRLVYRHQDGELPEDRDDAEIDDGEPEQGHFSPGSWWPILLAGACSLLLLGFAVGIWISFIALPLVVLGVIGWVYQYYRGYFGR